MFNKTITGLTMAAALGVLGFMQWSQQTLSPNLPSKQARLIEKEAKRDRPDLARQWWAARTRAPKGQNPEQLKLDAMHAIQKAEKQGVLYKSHDQLINLAFEDMGPGDFGGRVRALVIHPEQPDTAVIGGVAGGFWKTTDGGKSWRPIDDFLPTLAISSLIVDPDNPQRLFAGTGEGFFNVDAQSGAGIFVSEDFGETWTQLAATKTANFKFVNRIARIAGSNVLLAATREGLFRSDDLGQSFEKVANREGGGRGFVDVKSSPADNQVAVAVHYGSESGAPPILKINSPADLRGEIESGGASFGPVVQPDMLTADLKLINDGTGTATDACEDFTQDLGGKIALIDRGTCTFVDKVKRAQANGAVAVVIANNVDGGYIQMGGDDPNNEITIPALMVSLEIGNQIKDALSSDTVNATFTVGESLNYLMRSDDQGQTWVKLDENNGLPVNDVGRMELAFASNGRLYVAVANGNSETRGLWRSDDHATNFYKTASTENFIEGQGWYDLAITVDPNDPDTAYMGAISMFKTSDGGDTISQTSFSYDNVGKVHRYTHADHHNYTVGPDGSIWQGTDGGIYRSFDGGINWVSLNNGLNIAQPYGIAVSPDGLHIAAGNQDNGSQIFFGDKSEWVEWIGGDGMMTVWSQQNDGRLVGELQNGVIFKSDNFGSSKTALALPDSADAPFVTPLAMDPNDENRLLAGAYDAIYYMNNAFGTAPAWNAIEGTGNASAMTFNPHDGSQVFYGDYGGSVFRIDNIDSAPVVTRINNGDFLDTITSVLVDPNDTTGQTLYVTVGGYGFNRVRMTTNGGQSWVSIQSNLPAMPTWSIQVDPLEPNRLWLGTELGLWTGILSGTDISWNRYDHGTAFTRVVQLIWNDDNTLFIGTHGRGVFKAIRQTLAVEAGELQTAGSCNQDNYLEPGETAILPLTVRNLGHDNLSQVVVHPSLGLAGVEILPIGKTIGDLAAGASATVHFTLHNHNGSNSTCMQNSSITVQVSHDGGSFTQDVSLITHANDNLQNAAFKEDAEDADTLMSRESRYGGLQWKRVGTQANSGSQSWFVQDLPRLGDATLTTPWLTTGSDPVDIRFALRYDSEGNAEQYWDGAVMELRTRSNPDEWVDIGERSTVPYDGRLYINNTAPGRMAWSGKQDSWRQALVSLGTDFANDEIQVRFRMVTDEGTATIGGGFWLDDLEITGTQWSAGMVCSAGCEDGFRPYRGMGYDPTRDGHGFELQKQGDQYYLYFYSYDQNGDPEWFLGIGDVANGVFSTGTGGLYRFRYDNGQATLDTANSGTLSLDFNIDASDASCQGSDRSNARQLARMDWNIDGEQGSWCTELFLFDQQASNPDYSGSWSVEDANSGWGMTLNTQGNTVAAILYFYDAAGNPRWLIGTGTLNADGSASLNMSQAKGFCRTCTPQALQFSNAGTLELQLSTPQSVGSSNSRVTVDVQYLGSNGKNWQKTDVPLVQLSDTIEP